MKPLSVIIILSALVFLSCSDDLDTDLPWTDTSLYISGNTVAFPKGTLAIDIYNTVVSLIPENEYHDVNGNRKSIRTATAVDGLVTQTWQDNPFTKIRHTHSEHESGVNTHTVYLYASDTNIREIVFQWQRQTTNVWKNGAIEGDITFIF